MVNWFDISEREKNKKGNLITKYVVNWENLSFLPRGCWKPSEVL